MADLKTGKKPGVVIMALILIILPVAGAGFRLLYKGSDTSSKIQYEQAPVKKGDIIVGFDSDGTIEFSKVDLRFGVKGTISEVLVDEGDKVEKGTVIAKLDSSDYQDQYRLALAKLDDAREQQQTSLMDYELKLKNLESELQKLKDEYSEMEAIPEAYPANEIKLKKMELAGKELEYQNLIKKYELEKNQDFKQDELQVKMAEEDLEDTILYAPVSGVVLGLSGKVGESITDEQDFATIHENSTIYAITNVIEYDIGQISTGQKVYVTAEALPDKTFAGEVSKISLLPVSDSSGLVNYSVEVKITDPDPALKDGMTCTVSFIRKEVNNCLTVPYKAVKIIDGKQFVTVIDSSGQKTDRQIKAGFTDGTSVEVLEGLKANETVVYPKSR